jgi:hypothetical protein
MLKAVEGIYRDGKVELLETPDDVEEARVVVMFLPVRRAVDLRDRGFTEEEIIDLRSRLSAFAEDWERPEMDVYDAY